MQKIKKRDQCCATAVSGQEDSGPVSIKDVVVVSFVANFHDDVRTSLENVSDKVQYRRHMSKFRSFSRPSIYPSSKFTVLFYCRYCDITQAG